MGVKMPCYLVRELRKQYAGKPITALTTEDKLLAQTKLQQDNIDAFGEDLIRLFETNRIWFTSFQLNETFMNLTTRIRSAFNRK